MQVVDDFKEVENGFEYIYDTKEIKPPKSPKEKKNTEFKKNKVSKTLIWTLVISIGITVISYLTYLFLFLSILHKELPDEILERRIEISRIFFIVFFIFAVISLLLLIAVIICSIKFTRKLQYIGNIDFEGVKDYNNIILTKNNVYSLFNINIKIGQTLLDKKSGICKIKINPQMNNYLYIASAITVVINNEYTQTIFLDAKGCGEYKFPIKIDKLNEHFEITEVKGSMLRQN